MKKRHILFVPCLLTVTLPVGAAAADNPSTAASRESRFYAGDLGSTKYSALDQINVRNIHELRIAWRHPGVDPQILQTYPKLRVSNNLRATPLMANGMLYTSNSLGLVEAMDPATGKTLWIQEPVGVGIEGMDGAASRAISY